MELQHHPIKPRILPTHLWIFCSVIVLTSVLTQQALLVALAQTSFSIIAPVQVANYGKTLALLLQGIIICY